MGFRKDAYATVWSIEPVSDSFTKGRISISRKNKQTDEYETDFSGYVAFIGTLAAKKATQLVEKDRIKLGDVDVSTTYIKEKNTSYTNFKIFSFEVASSNHQGNSGFSVEGNEMEGLPDIGEDSELPWGL